MKRAYPLRVDCLEDRCVPAANLLDNAYLPPPPPPPDGPSVVTVDPTDTGAGTAPPDASYVIDVYPVDPNGVDDVSKPVDIDDTVPIPPSYWTEPPTDATLPPVDDPFLFPTSLVDEPFVIDVFPVDPNVVDAIDKPLEIDDTVPIDVLPSDATIPPVDNPIAA